MQQNNFCLPQTGTPIFPRQLLEFLFNSARVTLFYLSFSLLSHPLSPLSLFVFTQRARLGSKSFGPCTYVTRHSAAKTVSRDVASLHAPLPRLPYPHNVFPRRSSTIPLFPEQKLLIYHSYESTAAGSQRAQAEEKGRRECGKRAGGKW